MKYLFIIYSSIGRLSKKPFIHFVLTILVCLGLSNLLNAQTPIEKYQAESIYLQLPFWYVKNGEKHLMGTSRKQLEKEMKISPNAMLKYQRYKKNSTVSRVLSLVGAVAIGTSLALDADNNNLKDGLLYGGIGTILVSLPFTVKSTNSLYKSIWLRNGDLLLR